MEKHQIIILIAVTAIFLIAWIYNTSFTLRTILEQEEGKRKNPTIFVLCTVLMVFMFLLSMALTVLMSEEANKLRKQSIQVPPKYEKVTETFYRKKI